MISSSIQNQIYDAMKAKDELRVSTLKMLSSALSYEKIEKQKELTQEDEMAIVRKEAKKRRDAIEAYQKAGMEDRADQEKSELTILQEFLPSEMSDDEVEKLVDDAINETNPSGMQDMGRVIGEVMKKSGGRVDGSKVSQLVKEKLTSK